MSKDRFFPDAEHVRYLRELHGCSLRDGLRLAKVEKIQAAIHKLYAGDCPVAMKQILLAILDMAAKGR